jgi:DNA topoisomerase-3
VAKAKGHESDTVPGEFGQLKTPCPKCGGVIRENYKKFQCQQCDFSLWKIVASRQLEIPEVEVLITKRVLGPLQGFRSKMGKPFAAIIKLNAELKPEFDFGQQNQDDATAAKADFTGQVPLGKCPECGSGIYESGMSYICEKAARREGCSFRMGKIMCQRPIEKEQVQKLLTQGKTDLLDKFISKKGRPFKAFLVLGPDKKVGWEFEPRAKKAPGPGAAKTKETPPKPDLSKAEPVAVCPICGAQVLDAGDQYVCEKSQAEKRPCKFKMGKVILQQQISREQLQKLCASGRTDLLPHFISKSQRPFSAFLVLGDDHKVSFEFPSN